MALVCAPSATRISSLTYARTGLSTVGSVSNGSLILLRYWRKSLTAAQSDFIEPPMPEV
jgi:hypothetical protein